MMQTALFAYINTLNLDLTEHSVLVMCKVYGESLVTYIALSFAHAGASTIVMFDQNNRADCERDWINVMGYDVGRPPPFVIEERSRAP